MKLIEEPVVYEPDGSCILDKEGEKICDIRGWGKYQYMKDGSAILDSIGLYIQEAINEKIERDNKLTPVSYSPAIIFGRYWQCSICRRWTSIGMTHICYGA